MAGSASAEDTEPESLDEVDKDANANRKIVSL
jgi:hypothetical protein